MQTFLPYENFEETAKCLDYRRLGKQRVEAYQIINILEGKTNSNAWKNHPAVLMWDGYTDCLKVYYNVIVLEWINRGYKNNMPLFDLKDVNIENPWWLGNEQFHKSHKKTLLFKNSEYYSKFNWKEEPVYEYWWPTKNKL